ncbi:MAG: hypothetical protein A2471_04345 [Omnitrophica WOR_2 bacterium RIFOXYC2_FULL_45_15]|nr:MAG: hypothetical protein A2471_04345 [Omnitrophica WOR_2 bacterium RIFOXYC2_FULL_45_15]
MAAAIRLPTIALWLMALAMGSRTIALWLMALAMGSQTIALWLIKQVFFIRDFFRTSNLAL